MRCVGPLARSLSFIARPVIVILVRPLLMIIPSHDIMHLPDRVVGHFVELTLEVGNLIKIFILLHLHVFLKLFDVRIFQLDSVILTAYHLLQRFHGLVHGRLHLHSFVLVCLHGDYFVLLDLVF